MNKFIITKDISSRVLMAGNYYKNHHPGGISAVVQYWSEFIEDLQYYPTYKLSNIFVRTWYFLYSSICLAFRMLTDKNVKILHLHTAADGSFWRKAQLIKIAKFYKKNVILHIHASRFKDFYNESSSSKKQWILKTILKVDRLIVLSTSWQNWFESIGVPTEIIKVLHNTVSLPIEKQVSKVNDGKVHFLFLGEIGQRKGVFDILRALGTNLEQFAGKIEFRIGGNKNESQLMKFINDYKLRNIVRFEGWVYGDKKIELLNWADVFILPSFNEGLPISILEAMSYGHPIISTPVGGIPEIVATDFNGVLVEPGNHKAIADAMLKYINNPTLINTEGINSKIQVETYLPNYVLNNLKRVYEDLLEV